MKFFVRAVLSAAFVLSAAAPASACCLWPFGGWWGAGYSPGYGYGATYPAYSAGYYSAGYYPSSGYYSAGYASSSACCATSCCDPCGGSSCGSSSSCVGTTPSGTLKPAADDKFERKSYEDELERDREKLREIQCRAAATHVMITLVLDEEWEIQTKRLHSKRVLETSRRWVMSNLMLGQMSQTVFCRRKNLRLVVPRAQQWWLTRLEC